MAVDTTGSVSGSLISTLVLMPIFGLYSATIAIVFLTAIIIIILSKPQVLAKNFLICILLLFMSVLFLNEKLFFRNEDLLVDNAIARLEIKNTDIKNDIAQSKLMIINGSLSSKISKNKDLMFPYINYINKTFLDRLPSNKVHDILVLGTAGFSVGINDTRNNYTFIDIIKNLPEISEKYFLNEKLPDNKKFIAQDAYLYMLKNKQKYDIIILDVYSSLFNIPANFVTTDFFQIIKDHLKENGLMIANIITSASFKTPYSRRIDNSLRYVFKNSLSRQVIFSEDLNIYSSYDITNVIYSYYNVVEKDNQIYTTDKNPAVYVQ